MRMSCWRALAPVREYFSGREVNVNTVLAAYLRSRGLPVSGQPWEAAKQSDGARAQDSKRPCMSAASRPTDRHRADSSCREPIAHPI